MFIIVVGAGGIGQTLARTCLEEGHDVLVIDRDDQRCEEVTRQMDCVAVQGDATMRTVLEEAEVERADAVVTTTSQDAVNLMVIAHARDLGVPSLVSVVNEPSAGPMFRRYGANVVGDPDLLAADVLYRAIRRPHVGDFMSLGEGTEIFKVSLSRQSPLAGRTLKQARLPGETLIVAIEREGNVLVPHGGTVLKAGDGVTVLATGAAIEKAVELLAPDVDDAGPGAGPGGDGDVAGGAGGDDAGGEAGGAGGDGDGDTAGGDRPDPGRG